MSKDILFSMLEGAAERVMKQFTLTEREVSAMAEGVSYEEFERRIAYYMVYRERARTPEVLDLLIAGWTTPESDWHWFWVSFADGQWLGCSFVRALNFPHAHYVTKARGCNPGGEAQFIVCPPEIGAPPAEYQHVLIRDKDELNKASRAWTGDEAAQL